MSRTSGAIHCGFFCKKKPNDIPTWQWEVKKRSFMASATPSPYFHFIFEHEEKKRLAHGVSDSASIFYFIFERRGKKRLVHGVSDSASIFYYIFERRGKKRLVHGVSDSNCPCARQQQYCVRVYTQDTLYVCVCVCACRQSSPLSSLQDTRKQHASNTPTRHTQATR